MLYSGYNSTYITIDTYSAFDGTVKFLNERKAQQERSTISNTLRFFRVIKHVLPET